jgi:hypothetical protein
MKYKLLMAVLIAVSATVSISMIYVVSLAVHHFIGPEHRERKIDCGMAEFHPDFTPEMRAACRERRSHKL